MSECAPVHKREFHVFLSHASADKIGIVNELYHWLSKVANIPVWYDQASLSGGSSLQRSISRAIPKCRTMVLILSSSSMKSPWVESEYIYAINHRMKFKDFKIIPILIDDCEVPEFLQDSLYLDIRENKLTSVFYKNLIQAIYPFDPAMESRASSDIYVSRTWRADEADFADQICRKFIQADYRLIGDSKDHPVYRDGEKRVEGIMSSCGGLLAILPYREEAKEDYYTSIFCLDEIRTALRCEIPTIVIAEPGVEISQELKNSVDAFKQVETTDITSNELVFSKAVESMREQWIEPYCKHHVFLATSSEASELNQIACQIIQQITGMPCLLGQNVDDQEVSIQETISGLVKKAYLVIVNVMSKNSVNVLIEAGIARGADVNYRMLARQSSEAPWESIPFMLLDKPIKYHKNDEELLGGICKITYPFRRRILNYELSSE